MLMLSFLIFRLAVDCGALPKTVCSGSGQNAIQNLIDYFANWIVGLIGLIAILIIVVSGIQMITSAGNPDALKSARGRITSAVIGLVLLIAMRAVLALFLPGV